ncbi:hypothetical protein [Amycolatopsis sacchari]|uniref:hypothetical protein n=1 Tax=Amycolatopsis sacchari TaxID=115433 RepID=UPI003EBCDAF7
MSVEGAGPAQGTETATTGTADTETVVPEGRGDVRGISDLTYRIITPYLSHRHVQRGVLVVLIALTAVCLVATLVRLSPLPLLPVPLFAAGWFTLRKARNTTDDDRRLLLWSSLTLAAIFVGFWALSRVSSWMH